MRKRALTAELRSLRPRREQALRDGEVAFRRQGASRLQLNAIKKAGVSRRLGGRSHIAQTTPFGDVR
jgi:hypothetical protein